MSQTETILINSFDNKSLSDWSYYYTHGDHLGSHNKSMAEWTAQKWRHAGFDAWLAEYPIWYTYPEHSSLTLIRADGTTHEANLVEDVLTEDDTSSYPNLIPAYHAMSGSGNVTAEYVYVGRGTRADFQVLIDAGIDLKGKIAMANYGGIYRGTKVKNAQDNGMAGCIIFTDPLDDGEVTEENGYEAYPSHGVTAKEANRSGWIGGFGNITYDSGPAPGALVNMDHLMHESIEPVWDVIGVINGTNHEEVVVVGNHRDAWVIGGAADPNSGSAVLIELANAFGKLLERGWKPRRTIILGSWDAEEFGLQGSTEWVESHLPWLQTTAVAYLNLDVAVSGPRTAFSGSGEIQTFVVEQMKKILFPEDWGNFTTLYDMWYNVTEGEISPLGSGSDYASFYQNGIGCIDIGSDGGKTDPVYHYHSNYDSYAWMSKFGDPGFKVHTSIGQWLTLILYHIADDPLIPWDLPNAASVLSAYFAELNETIADSDFPGLEISPIADAIKEFTIQAENIAKVAQTAVSFNDSVMVEVVNSKYKDFSRGFASAGGLPGRETFKNVISAPGIDNGYGADVFPAVMDNINAGNEVAAVEWIDKTAKAVLRAAEILRIGN
ncbi:hypothetical protein SLS63_013791 [Diaporthe eres]|uniref:Zn-dependent exopeptidase n=1 Tax=Diaporthe eres TaxID=83184 RepID=A0ABR1NMI3_DIAER